MFLCVTLVSIQHKLLIFLNWMIARVDLDICLDLDYMINKWLIWSSRQLNFKLYNWLAMSYFASDIV